MSASLEACMQSTSGIEEVAAEVIDNHKTTSRRRIIAACTVMLVVLCSSVLAQSRLRMSTTTSTDNSGLLQVLLPLFEKECNCKVDVIAVGTGKALKLGEQGDVDVVLVHARTLEDKFVAEGFGVNRRDVMYNDFIVIGPANDPAGLRYAVSATDAFRRIAAKQALFVSRGDDSGTNQKENEIWASASIRPAGAWYRSVGQGMGEVITMATELRAYTLSDRGTYNAFHHGKTDLAVLYDGNGELAKPRGARPQLTAAQVSAMAGSHGLFNPYGVIAVNPRRFPHVHYDLAMKFIAFVVGPEGQQIIANYRVFGDPVFFTYRTK